MQATTRTKILIRVVGASLLGYTLMMFVGYRPMNLFVLAVDFFGIGMWIESELDWWKHRP